MKMKLLLTGLAFCAMQAMLGQIKIGDNPQNLDAGSVLELESSNRALVITRLSTAQMNNLTPLQGALVYNTDVGCIHYYDGSNWINLCEASAFELTNDAIVNADTTIALTRNGSQINVEVDEITGLNIVDQSLRTVDYGLRTVAGGNILERTIEPINIQPGGSNQVLKTDGAGANAIWSDPDVAAMGKVFADGTSRSKGASVLRLSDGLYLVTLAVPRLNADYVVQLSVSGNFRINIASLTQTDNSFAVEIRDPDLNELTDSIWYFTVLDF